MNISGLTALLLDLAYQSKSQVTPAARTDGVHKPAGGAEQSRPAHGTLAAGAHVGHITGTGTKDLVEQPLPTPAFTPLPLRSDYFREINFFARFNEEEPGTAPDKAPVRELFICLFTENLGRIWIGLLSRNEKLTVRCFTDNEPVSKAIRVEFPQLRERLQGIGFTEVALTSQTRTELGTVLTGLMPKFEKHLLDRKI